MLVEIEGEERLYFALETKGIPTDLRLSEQAKVSCGKKHFEALQSGVLFEVIDTVDSLQEHLSSLEKSRLAPVP